MRTMLLTLIAVVALSACGAEQSPEVAAYKDAFEQADTEDQVFLCRWFLESPRKAFQLAERISFDDFKEAMTDLC